MDEEALERSSHKGFWERLSISVSDPQQMGSGLVSGIQPCFYHPSPSPPLPRKGLSQREG
jgi:hypothetical protein